MKRPELADLVAQLGPDHPVCRAVEQRDAYSQEPLPPEPRLTPIDTPDQSSYWSQVPNPARGGKSPPLYFVADEHGIVAGRYGKDAEDSHKPDVHVQSLIKTYSKRKRVIAETRTYRGASTDELPNNPNTALDTPITPSTPESNHNA